MSTETYTVPWQNRLARVFLRPIFRTIFRILARVVIQGREHIPERGAYLIAMNHVSIFDPPFIIAFWPTCPEALGAIEIWSKPGQSTLARLFGGIPVRRGQFDRQVIETTLKVLRSGKPLVIAPEGGRSHTPGMRRGLPGIAYATDQARVPVIPVGISGTTDVFFQQAIRGKRPLLVMNIGRQIILPPVTGKGDARRAARQQNVDQIMYAIARLLPEEYRGEYFSSDLDKRSAE